MEALIKEAEDNPDNQLLNTYLKVKPWEENKFSLKVSSQCLGDKTLRLLLMKPSLTITNHKLLKKCHTIFKVENQHQ